MSRFKGNIAEDRACNYLNEHGFSLLERNFYTRFGEIDIIAYKDDVIHFVEVKSGVEYESAVQNMTRTKISRLLKSIDVYIKKNSISRSSYMLDLVVVTPSGVEMLENITI